MRFVGPIEPATKRGTPVSRAISSQARRASLRAFAIELGDDGLEPVIRLRDRRRRECVGLDDVGAGAQILAVDVENRLRLRQDQEIIVPAQVLVMVLEARAAKILFRELVALHHRAHRAVEDQNARVRALLEGCENRGAVSFIESHASTFSRTGRTPRR